jgi:phospholipid/cholesterol/gamma-HCH transport system substrate-binding protein
MLVLVGFFVLGFVIFYITGAAGLFEPQYTITGYFATANGLRKGAEVWLEGVPVGNVDSVNVLAVASDPSKSVQVALGIYRKYQEIIRTDSKLTITTQGPLGNNVVEISRGTPAGQVVPDGGTLQGENSEDIKRIISGANDFVGNLNALSDEGKEIMDRINRGEGTIGKLKTDKEIHNNLSNTLNGMSDLMSDLRSGNGTIGLNAQNPLQNKANAVLARTNQMADYVRSGNGTLGRISSLADRADTLVSRFQQIANDMDRGSVAKIAKDENLFRPTIQKINDLSNTVENGAMAQFLHSDTFHATTNQISSEIYKLFYDFSKNPAKYLKIDLGLF